MSLGVNGREEEKGLPRFVTLPTLNAVVTDLPANSNREYVCVMRVHLLAKACTFAGLSEGDGCQ